MQTDSNECAEPTQSTTTTTTTTNTANQSDGLDDETQQMNVPNDAQSADESLALISFSASETQIGSSDEVKVDNLASANISLNTITSEQCDDLMNFTACGEQTEHIVGAIKSQPSDGSVITISSEESQITSTQETLNNSVGVDVEEDLFEKSIRSPPPELQDELFDTDAVDDEEEDITMDESIYHEATVDNEIYGKIPQLIH